MKNSLEDKINGIIPEHCKFLDKSLNQFADNVITLHQEESEKQTPDNRLLEVLEDCLRVAFELTQQDKG